MKREMSAVTPREDKRVAAIHLLRGMAALLVVYAHLVRHAAMRAGGSWWPNDALSAYVLQPLHITLLCGPLAVFIFFLISGFVIAHVAERETRREFAVKRIFRIYPPLVVAILMVVGLAWINLRVHLPALPATMPSLREVLLGMLLFHITAAVHVLGVAWTLTVEVFFYVHAWVLLGWLRRKPVATALVLATWGVVGTHALLLLFRYTGWAWPAHMAQMVHYLPLFATGVLGHVWYQRRLSTTTLAALAPIACGAYVWNLHYTKPSALTPELQYPLQLAYAAIIFFATLALDSRLRIGRTTGWIGDISYSLYLVHMPLGFVILAWLFGRLGLPLALTAAVAGSLVVSWAIHVFVEKPSQRAARAILGKRSRASTMAVDAPAA